ncbi:Nif3-like dinuclear metal center hexameric protein [Fibrobacterota bacterium]
MLLKNLESSLNTLYKPWEFDDHVPSGLIVEGKKTLKEGITAVSLSEDIIKEAVKRRADFLVVHHAHGFWDNQSRKIIGATRNKIALLLKNGISLFAFHLPMDSHPEIGNNIGILKKLGLQKVGGFIPLGTNYLGLVGEFNDYLPRSSFRKLVSKRIGKINFSFFYGKEAVKRVAVSAGGAAGSIREAKETGAQVFLTGEAKEDTYIYCRDEKFNFLASGHYRSEVFGPRLLAAYLTGREHLPTKFIHLPNPV